MKGSLYSLIASQHLDQVVPMRCMSTTLNRLSRRFCDLVVDNELSAFVVQGRCLDGRGETELHRNMQVAAASRYHYLFTCEPGCAHRTWGTDGLENTVVFEQPGYHDLDSGPFILIADPHFSGLLASERVAEEESGVKIYDMVWSFEPNVVYTALEYLMARVMAQHPEYGETFSRHLHVSAPSSVSLRLTLSLTTKLALMLQRQSEIEMTISRISTLVNSSFALDEIGQSITAEIAKTLHARRVSLTVWDESNRPEDVFESVLESTATDSASASPGVAEPIEFPLMSHGEIFGVLTVEDDLQDRLWEEEEIVMVRTIADHLAVGIANARLFKRVEEQAITDELTGFYNRRYFQTRLETEIRLADRTSAPLSLILFDLDHLKRINDTYGHVQGDEVLRHVARVTQAVVRTVDICARYGGEEFVVIMPHTDQPGAILAAERLRNALATHEVGRVGSVTASFGVSTYPGTAASEAELLEEADRAMYIAKRKGRNQVAVYSDRLGPHLPEDLEVDEAEASTGTEPPSPPDANDSSQHVRGRSQNL